MTVRIAHMNEGRKGDSVTNGGLAGIGDFTASGAISEQGKVVVYRTVKDASDHASLRHRRQEGNDHVRGQDRHERRRTSRWTIISATKAYKGLHGEGIESENADYTISTLTGTVSR